MEGAHGVCKECGEDFFVDSENCGTDESLCEECFNLLQEEDSPIIIQRVKMLKTLAPKEIPNGSIGTAMDGRDIKERGLHYVEFDCNYAAYVYPHEVEKI